MNGPGSGAVAGAVKLTGDAIQATRDRLEEMVSVADNSKAIASRPELLIVENIKILSGLPVTFVVG